MIMGGGAGERVVIVGGGQAAAQVIDGLERGRFKGRIALVGEEHVLPYCRPPLSKSYLVGDQPPDWLLYRPRELYERLDVELHLGRRAIAIDRTAARITLSDGTDLAYDRLVLATGTRVRRLDIAGEAESGVCYIRTLSDVEAIRARLPHARRIVVIGGGFIGLETAAVLVQTGCEVTVLAAQERLLPRAAPEAVSRFMLDQHLLHGVRVITGAQVTELRRDVKGQVSVHCEDGSTHFADLVIVGIGITPNQELALDAGIACDDGILVDDRTFTNDPSILSVGDCTRHPNRWAGTNIRLETVHNAVEQAKSAAAALCGTHLPYDQIPWVWSDQYKLRLQTVGTQTDADELVTRGDPASGRFAIFYFRAGMFRAMTAVNRPREFGACRRMLNRHLHLTPAQAADTAFDLETVAPRQVRIDFDDPWPARTPRAAQPLPTAA